MSRRGRARSATAAPSDLPEPSAADRVRLDVWLWRARFARTRTLAAALVSEGRVRLDGTRCTSPGRAIAPGAVLTLALPMGVIFVRMKAAGTRRGPAPEARGLYERLDAAAEPAPAGDSCYSRDGNEAGPDDA